MGYVQSRLKQVEVPRKLGKKDFPATFAEALETGVIGATRDAKPILLAFDQEAGNLQPANDESERSEWRYDLRVVHKRMPLSYLISFGQHLLGRGWSLFLNHEAFLMFVCREFQSVIPVGFESVSVPIQVRGRLRAMTVSPWKPTGQVTRVVVDIHPTAYAEHMLIWPLEQGEKILLLR